jgi:hypothetical protein
MFIYTFILFSISCEIVRRPVTLWFSKKSSRSFKNIANKKVYKFSPWVDNLFTLYSFFELLKRKKEKMHCALIDFEKAFEKRES